MISACRDALRRISLTVGGVSLTGALAACGGGHTGAASVIPQSQASATSTGLRQTASVDAAPPSSGASSQAQTLFVANKGNNTVTVYAPTGTPPYSGTPTVISNGINSPQALAVDTNGDLFVANSNSIAEYKPPYTAAPLVIATGTVNTPEYTAITVAPSGALFVLNWNVAATTTPGFTDTLESAVVDEYLPPYTASPIAVGSGSIYESNALAVDNSGNLFVSNGEGSITEYIAPAYTTAQPLLSGGTGVQSVSCGSILVLDPAGNLFASCPIPQLTPGVGILEIPKPYTPINLGLGIPASLMFGNITTNFHSGFAVNATDNLFVGTANDTSITEFGPPTLSAFNSGVSLPVVGTITDGVSTPVALLTDKSNNLFSANSSTVTEYAPPYTGTPTTISNGVNKPVALALGTPASACPNLYPSAPASTSSDPRYGDIIVYQQPGAIFGENTVHVGIVTCVQGSHVTMIRSKWGAGAVYDSDPDGVPPSYGYNWSIYRRKILASSTCSSETCNTLTYGGKDGVANFYLTDNAVTKTLPIYGTVAIQGEKIFQCVGKYGSTYQCFDPNEPGDRADTVPETYGSATYTARIVSQDSSNPWQFDCRGFVFAKSQLQITESSPLGLADQVQEIIDGGYNKINASHSTNPSH